MTQELGDEVRSADLDRLTAAKETLEDYTLRFAPRSYRKWSTRVVGISALGGIAYLADFAIGEISASPTGRPTRCGESSSSPSW